MKNKILSAVVLLGILLAVVPAGASAASAGYWKMTSSTLQSSPPSDGEYWKSSVAAGAGGATFTTRGAQNEFSQTSTAWSEPPERIEPDSPFSISLSAKVDALTNKASSHVSVKVFSDIPGLGLGSFTNAREHFADSAGVVACETVSDSAALTVVGSLSAGSQEEQRAIYVESYNDGMLVQSQYVYSWIVNTEGAGDSGTRISALFGTVEVASDEDFQLDRWHFAKPGEVLPVNAHIRTGEESGCVLSFADMSTIQLKEETHIVLLMQERDNKVTLIWGRIRANIQRMMEDGSMEVDTSQAAMSIKGTTFVCEDNDTTSTLKVQEGTVAITAKTTGETVLCEGGWQLSADAGGLSSPEAFDSAAEDALWQNAAPAASMDASAYAELAEPDRDTGSGVLLLILLGMGAVFALLAGILLAVRSKKKRAARAAATVVPAQRCPGALYSPPAVQPNAPFCGQCGAQHTPNAAFCPKCGSRLL